MEKNDNLIQLVNRAIEAALAAGLKINEVYSLSDFNISLKDDLSPITLADQRAHDEISVKLKSTKLPILSEEGECRCYDDRKKWNMFWLVDPLDGTKEFIKHNGEFTVNIALIERNRPVAGVVYAPVTGFLYAGIVGVGAFRQLISGETSTTFSALTQSGTRLPDINDENRLVVALSRSHMNDATVDFVEKLKQQHQIVEIITKGSSLKICMVAEGSANIYPKLGPTMEWDTAAAHAIVKASGKNIYQADSTDELCYNKENLQNPYFIVT